VREELNAVIKTDSNDAAGIYPGSIFMNDDFTFDTLTEQVRRHRIMHVATHAEFVPNIRDASYILSGSGAKLTIDQIGALDTQFDRLHLVVLSAYQTALGGESLLTKAEVLRQAQLSLLKGETTLEARFENLGIGRGGGLVLENTSNSPPATLEQPCYWAPFILIGNSL
jgi:CHAT domain-containing protein